VLPQLGLGLVRIGSSFMALTLIISSSIVIRQTGVLPHVGKS